jgi:hypothetical protein
MRLHKSFAAVSVAVVMSLAINLAGQGPKGPVINDRFPIKDGNELSPPIVSPVGECAQAVHVSGFIPHAVVRVFVNGSASPSGAQQPYFADADITLSAPLNLGDTVAATQEVLGITSAPSVDPVVVGAYPASLNKPVVGSNLYACGRIVPVDNLNPGTTVDVFRNGDATPIGSANATQSGASVFTQALVASDKVTAVQTACPALPAKKIVSATSAAVSVQTGPSPPPAPTLDPYPVGADAVVLRNLFVGAEVQVFDHATPSGGGFANASADRAPLNPAASSTSSVSATQQLCTTSPHSTPQGPSSTLQAPVIVTPVCENTHYVTLQGTYPNAIVVLYRNGAISGMAGGVLGELTMALGGGASWALSDEIQALQYVGSVISPRSATVFADCAPDNVLTQHNNNSRTGAYTAEKTLTPANVNPTDFGLLYTRNVDGDTMSQPLYMRGVKTANGVKNLIFVTTSKNNVYAFDADDLDTNPANGLVWSRNLCSSVKSTVCGETPSGLVGITSTPVIDASTETMYVVPRCSDGTGSATDGAIYMHALNVADGTDRVPRVQINATDPANSSVKFDFHCQRNRPGLLLSKGSVYAAFATFSCDAGCASQPYHGWVLGYRENDLQQDAVFDTSPNNGGVGIWQTGNGVVGANDGSIYFQTGNGPDSEPLQDSFVKLSPTGTAGLTEAASFTPNDAATLSAGDTDLGSGGPMLLPNGRLIGGGKQGRYYVLDAANLHETQDTTPDALGYDGFQSFINTYHNDSSKAACAPQGGAAGCNPTTPGTDCYIAPGRYSIGELCGPNIHGGPIFLQTTPSSGFVFEMPEKDFLKGFKYDFTSHKVTETPAIIATGTLAKPPTDGMPGGFSSVSANGMKSGIVWTSMPFGDAQWTAVPGRIAAFDAATLTQLWSDDDDITFAKSVPPTVADGKVIRATAANQVVVYGLLKEGRPRWPRQPIKLPPWLASLRPLELACYSIDQKYANYGSDIGMLGVADSPMQPAGDYAEGQFRNFRGRLYSASHPVTSNRPRKDAEVPSCSMPPHSTEALESAIYWSRQTCAHVVEGDILKLWLKLGGVKSNLGYPIDDETLTPDRAGRMSIFEHGEIWWYPAKGAYVRESGPVIINVEETQRLDRELELRAIKEIKEEERERK